MLHYHVRKVAPCIHVCLKLFSLQIGCYLLLCLLYFGLKMSTEYFYDFARKKSMQHQFYPSFFYLPGDSNKRVFFLLKFNAHMHFNCHIFLIFPLNWAVFKLSATWCRMGKGMAFSEPIGIPERTINEFRLELAN